MSGPYRLRAVRVGVLPVPGWELVFGHNDTDFHELHFYVWLLSDGVRHVLVDAGLPTDPADLRALDEACQAVDPRCVFADVVPLPDALDRLAVSPDSIDVLLLSQPITYHSGGLERRWFPRADVYVSRAGIAELLTDPPGHPPVSQYFTAASWAYLRELAVDGRLHVSDGPEEVVPGVVFETTGGHHPGSAGVRVPTPDGVVGLLETAFVQRNVDEVVPIGIAENAALCRKVIARYRRECDLVIPLHDPANASRYQPDEPS